MTLILQVNTQIAPEMWPMLKSDSCNITVLQYLEIYPKKSYPLVKNKKLGFLKRNSIKGNCLLLSI